MLRQEYILLSGACITYPRMTKSNLMRSTDIPMGMLSSTWTCKEKGCFLFFQKKPTVGTMFFDFLSKVSWNLVLLILLCLFLPPPLMLTGQHQLDAVSCRTPPLIFKDLSWRLSCDDLQISRRKLPESQSSHLCIALLLSVKDYKLSYQLICTQHFLGELLFRELSPHTLS